MAVVAQEGRTPGQDSALAGALNSVSRALGRNAVWVATLALLTNSLLRGIRMPGYWAATHMLFNYQFGFSKRALLGSLLTYLNLYSYRFCALFSAVVLAANVILLAALLKRMIASEARAVLVYVSSAALVFLAHTIGYFEQITLFITLLALRIERFYARAAFVAIFYSASLLIHETGFLLFFPLLCFSFLLEVVHQPDRGKIVTLGALVLGITVETVILGQTHLSHTAVAAMQTSLQASADFPLRDDAFQLLERSLRDNLQIMQQYWQNPLFLLLQLVSSITILPTTLYILSQTWRHLAGMPRVRWAAVLASLAPLSLHVLGMDLHRWNTLATTTSFLVLAVASQRFPSQQAHAAPPNALALLSLPGALIMLNLSSAVPLFDFYTVQDFPFHDHLKDLLEILRGHSGVLIPQR